MSFLDFLFPKYCVGCRKNGTYFCTQCAQSVKVHFPQVCPVCERPSLDGVKHSYCSEPFSPEGLFVVWVYEGVVKNLIVKLKYRFVSEIATDLTHQASVYLKGCSPVTKKLLWNKSNFVLTPIPLHAKRNNWRGFNQSEEVGRLLSKNMGWGYADLLVRTKNTIHQVGLRGQERRSNVQGVFSLRPNRLIHQHSNILLFDDVWTTGSTMKEAVKVLKKAGAKKVWCLTLAR